MKVIVTGAGGMVGQAVRYECERRGDEVMAYDRESLDITDADLVLSTFERDLPSVVINCAAWTDVDGCERDPARAQAANSLGPENLATPAAACKPRWSLFPQTMCLTEIEGFYTPR